MFVDDDISIDTTEALNKLVVCQNLLVHLRFNIGLTDIRLIRVLNRLSGYSKFPIDLFGAERD